MRDESTDSAAPATPFGERLAAAIAARESCLVVGLDPVLERLPRDVKGTLSVRASGSEGFTARAAATVGLFLERVLDSVRESAVAVKPNVAFFERFGPPGWDCLTLICRRAQEAGLFVILDAKRGDIGHTATAYADALFGDTPDTPGPYVDAITLNPYLGTDSVRPFLDRAEQTGRGLFILVRTSNPSAAEIQGLDAGGAPLFVRVAELVRRWADESVTAAGWSPVGAVAGATAPAEAAVIRTALPHSFLLAPGLGAQGATAEDLAPFFLPGGRGAIVNASRAILFAHEGKSGSWADVIRDTSERTRAQLEAVRTAVK